MTNLTILIPTIQGREAQFDALVDSLNAQGFTNIVHLKDNKEISIGAKRQLLLDKCETDYFVMIDDDDSVAPNYIARISQALLCTPDCVTYLESVNGNQVACHSNVWNAWGNNKEGFTYVRTPFYKDVLRTDIAKKIGFKDMRYGEDHNFSIRLKQSGLIKTEIFINELMYFYSAPPSLTTLQHKARYGG